MRCEQFEHRLNHVLDHRQAIESDAPLRRHANDCVACRELLEAYRRLTQCDLAEMPTSRVEQQHHLPADLFDATGRSCRTRTSGRARPRRHAWRKAIPVLACGAAVLFMTLIPAPSSTPLKSPSGNLVRHAGTPEREPTPIQARQVSSTSVDQQALASHTPAFALHQPLLGLHLISRGDWSQALDTVRANVAPEVDLPNFDTTWLDAMTSQMEPVQSSVHSTLNVLRTTWLGKPQRPVNG